MNTKKKEYNRGLSSVTLVLLILLSLLVLNGCNSFTPVKPDFPSLKQGFKKEGDVLWIDLLSKDVVGAKNFYSALFGWQYVTNETGYITIFDKTRAIGGMILEAHVDANSRWMPMFSVVDLQKSLETAVRLQGKIPTRPIEIIPGVNYAVIADTEGAAFGVMSGVNGLHNESYTQLHSVDAQLWSHNRQEAYKFYKPLFALKVKSTHPRRATIDKKPETYQKSKAAKKTKAIIKTKSDENSPPVLKMNDTHAKSIANTEELPMRGIFSAVDNRYDKRQKTLIFGNPYPKQQSEKQSNPRPQNIISKIAQLHIPMVQIPRPQIHKAQIQYGIDVSMNLIELPVDDIPAQWVVSFLVTNPDEVLRKVIPAGGIILVDFNDPRSDGSVAVIEDPMGAVFMIKAN